jgi:hypothetical protein
MADITWQYCRGDNDITGEFHREQDADEVRAWDGDFVMVAVTRSGEKGEYWTITASDAVLPIQAYYCRMSSPEVALQYVKTLMGV